MNKDHKVEIQRHKLLSSKENSPQEEHLFFFFLKLQILSTVLPGNYSSMLQGNYALSKFQQ